MLNELGTRDPRAAAADQIKHITVCICTYKRPALLEQLLREVDDQETRGLFTYSVVVTDNDQSKSAKPVVEEFQSRSKLQVTYCIETKQNIALARNRAIANATGNFVAFIDDDEFPTKQWLLLLFNTCEHADVGGVLDPVLPHFSDDAPRWVIDGGFYDRPRHPTGLRLNWSQTRTGNVLLKTTLFDGDAGQPFNPECLEGSDQEFFKRKIQLGHSFIWCDEAVAYEVVPPARWKRRFLIRRALFRGVFAVRNHGFSLRPIATSLIATPVYAAALPIALALGQARFMNLVFKLCYHSGRLLGLVGINPIRGSYVSD